MQNRKALWCAVSEVTGGDDFAEHLDRVFAAAAFDFIEVALALFFAATQFVERRAIWLDVGEIGTVEVGHGQFAEDVVEDRRRVLDRVVALHHAGWFKPGEGEGVDELIQWNAILEADRDGDGEVVHHRAEASAFLVHVDEDLTELAVLIFPGAEVHFVTTDDGFLRVASAALWHPLAAFGDLFDDDLFDHLLGEDGCFFLRRSAFEDFGGFVVVFDQCGSERLRQLGAVAVERVGLDAQGPAEFVSCFTVFDRCIVRHVDRLGDRAGDERLSCGHHGDVAVDAEEALAFLAARVRTVEDAVVLFLQVRCAFEGHSTADVVVGGLNVLPGEAEVAQKVEGWVGQLFGWDAERAGAEFFAQCPLVEDEPDVEGRWQGCFDLFQFCGAEAVTHKRRVVDASCVAERAVADRVGNDLFDLGRAVAELFKSSWHRAVDDLEVTAACKLFELHECEVRLDAGGVAIHDKTDGAGWCNHGGLCVAVTVLFTQGQSFVPAGFRQFDKTLVGAVGVVEHNRVHVHLLIAVGFGVGGTTVVAHDAEHVIGILGVTRECSELARHFCGGCISHAGHNRGERATECPAFVGVVAVAHVHQEAADVGIAEAKCTEVVGQLRDFL